MWKQIKKTSAKKKKKKVLLEQGREGNRKGP